MRIHNFNWKYFKNYVETYNPGKHAMNDPNIVLDDMLYGIGVSISDKKYKWADGYRHFKSWLVKFLNNETL